MRIPSVGPEISVPARRRPGRDFALAKLIWRHVRPHRGDVDVNRKRAGAQNRPGSAARAFRLLQLCDLRTRGVDKLSVGVSPPRKAPPAFDRLGKEDPGPGRK